MTDTSPNSNGEYGQCTASHHRREGERCEQPAVSEHGYCASHAPPDPEQTKHGRCTATSKTTGDRCGQPAVGPHGKCTYHGGATPTKDEDPNVGAPEGNARNLQHGAYADPLNLYRHLPPEERQWVDSLVQGYVDLLGLDADDPRLERLLRACVHIYQSWSAEDRILEDGLSEETVVGVNGDGQPIITREDHHLHQFSVQRDREAQKILKELGCFSDDTHGGADLGDRSSDSYTVIINPDGEVEDED